MKFSHLTPKKSSTDTIDMTILEMAAPRKNKSAQPGENALGGGPEAVSEKIPEFKPKNSSLEQTVELFEDILENMANKRDYKQYAGMLLTGDPGTGKTQRIALLSKVLGIDLITVEAPHIVEEHIINIPFIVFEPAKNKETVETTTLKGDLYKVVLADSNLYTALKKADHVSDTQHLKNIYKSSKDVVATYEALGGTPTELPEEIVDIRKQFKVILFLDEYFRQNSPRIKNMLRGILNGKIGNHDIPKGAYVVYASNMHDEGLSEIQKNFQFENVEIKNPSKDEWFTWLVNKFEDDKHVRLKPALINRFHHILDDEDMSHNDIGADVRTSPRRWEQLLLYINAALPAKDEKDAIGLMTNVKTNFRNYLEGDHSILAKKVLEATATLIKETSGFEVSATAQNSASDWRSTLKHQIETKMKLGDMRKYVPIIAGLPGIGKTAQAYDLAKELDLRFIDLDCSTLTSEDVAGLPLPSANEDDPEKIETIFSMPSLYQLLMEKIKEEDKKYLKKLEKQFPKEYDEKKKEYEARQYKYLIFFDELNRNSPKVFNGIRRVLLEKNFGPSNKGKGKLLELPSSAIMLGAINPDDNGAERLTKHMQDVLDIMDAKSSWKDTLSYLSHEKNEIPGAPKEIHHLSLAIVKLLANKFETKAPEVEPDHRPFFWDISKNGQGQEVYISPREYNQLYVGMGRSINRQINKIKKLDFNSMKQEDLMKLEGKLRAKIFKAIKKNTKFILFKHNAVEDFFYHDLEAYIMHSDDIDLGENFFYKKAVNVKEISLEKVIGKYLEGDSDKIADNDSFLVYLQNADIQTLRENLADVLTSKIADDASVKKFIFDHAHPALRLAVDDKLFTKKDLSNDVLPNGIILDESKKVSLLENFFRGVAFSLQIHSIANDRINVILIAALDAAGVIHKNFKTDQEEEGGIESEVSKLQIMASKITKRLAKSDELPDA